MRNHWITCGLLCSFAVGAQAGSAEVCLYQQDYRVQFFSAFVDGQSFFDEDLSTIDLPVVTGRVIYDPSTAFENDFEKGFGTIIDVDIKVRFKEMEFNLDESDDPNFGTRQLFTDKFNTGTTGFDFGPPAGVNFPDPVNGPNRIEQTAGNVNLGIGQNGYSGTLQFREAVKVPECQVVPSPTAALGGMVLLGFVGMRRRR